MEKTWSDYRIEELEEKCGLNLHVLRVNINRLMKRDEEWQKVSDVYESTSKRLTIKICSVSLRWQEIVKRIWGGYSVGI